MSWVSTENAKKFFIYVREFGLGHALRMTADKIRSRYDGARVYAGWIKKSEQYDRQACIREIESWGELPLISILVPVYNTPIPYLQACIESVQDQYYPCWELCIADDASPDPRVREALNSYAEKDSRIKIAYREQNGHISAASNTALAMAAGDFTALLDHDDILAPFALYEAVRSLREHPEWDMLYTDEDKIDEGGKRAAPYFKPDWSPDTLLSSMYTCHLGVYRTGVLKEIGGFREGYEGAQDYDLMLRFTEKTQRVGHVPQILYHWRMIEGSTALTPGEKGYAWEAGYRALRDAFGRRGIDAQVHGFDDIPYYDVAYTIDKSDHVTVVIPTRDHGDDLTKCVDSIYERTHMPFDILIVDNGSTDADTLALFESYKEKYDNFGVLRLDIPFNFSRLNNEAAKAAEGNLLLFLNNDTAVITDGWLSRMAGHARQPGIGAVGAKLYYPDDTIQHCGVLLGVGGVANHAYLGLSRADNGYFAGTRIVQNMSAVTGACLMVKRDLFLKLGGFNEDQLAVAFNDIDLCLRLMEAGYRNVIIPAVALYHDESKSRGNDNQRVHRDRFQSEIDWMEERYGDALAHDPYYNINLTRDSALYRIETDPWEGAR